MKKYHFDYYLFCAVAALVILGILVLASISAASSQANFGKTTYYLFHQIIYGLVPGLIFGFVAFKIKLSFLKKLAWPFILASLVLMALVFIPGLGIIARGAPRWLNLGIVSFQPSEFLKITFILYLAAWLASPHRKGWMFTLFPFLVVIGVIAFLLTEQSDVSTLGLIVFVAILVYFAAGNPLWHTILVILITIGGLLGLVKISPYRMMRLKVLLGLVKDPMGIGYQIKQALITVGSGGIFGLGLDMSSQKFGFLPQTMSDSIFAIFSEETGFIGSAILILIFLFFLWRTIRIAKISKDKFSQLLVVGISSWICLQAFINIGSMIGILPLTGIPLPFISYGGSHMVVELIGVGILLNISKKC